MPDRTPLVESVTPEGNAPVSVTVAVGEPVVVTENVPAVPTVKVVLFPLVMLGGTSMLIVSAPEDAEAAPAPLAVTVFETLDGAFEATFTSITSAG